MLARCGPWRSYRQSCLTDVFYEREREVCSFMLYRCVLKEKTMEGEFSVAHGMLCPF